MLEGTCHCGASSWRLDGPLDGKATACNCDVCRRYGALWFFGWQGEDLHVEGPTRAYTRRDIDDPGIDFTFCPTCGNLLAWLGRDPHEDGRRRGAVNLRLAPLAAVADLPMRHFDGHDSWEAVERPGRTVADMWF